jgi:GntR family transcriptional regulator, transcriptional repressor for pyruvate dehydrogenase complex
MDDVLSRLLQVVIDTGAVQPGNHRFRLPTERALAASLAVPRSLVRERLAALEHLGVVERTQGSGTYVNPPSPEVIRWYFDLALTLGYIGTDEIQATRAMLEREIARQAARVATPEDVAELDRLCQRMTEASSPDERTAVDYDFHRRLALAARNPVILLIIDGLAGVLRRVLARRRALVASLPAAAHQQDAAHPPIVEAIRARDPERAAAAMDEHFRITDELLARSSALLVGAPQTASDVHTPRSP